MVKIIKWGDVPEDVIEILEKVKQSKVSDLKINSIKYILVAEPGLEKYIRLGEIRKVIATAILGESSKETIIEKEIILGPNGGCNFNCFPPTTLDLLKPNREYIAKTDYFAYELNKRELSTLNNFLEDYFKL